MADNDDHDDLKQRVLALTYQNLITDTRKARGITGQMPPGTRPSHFLTYAEIERTRAQIVRECEGAGVAAELAEYLSTRWLDQFRPIAH